MSDGFDPEKEHAAYERITDRLNDMRPFVQGLLSPAEAHELATNPPSFGTTIRKTCPFCQPDQVQVKLTRRKKGWRIGHPLPLCQQFARYAEAT